MLLLSMVGNQKPASSKTILSVVPTSFSLNDLATDQKPGKPVPKIAGIFLPVNNSKTVSAYFVVLIVKYFIVLNMIA